MSSKRRLPGWKSGPPKFQGLTVMVRRALRLAAGTASLAAGTWLRCVLHRHAGRARCRRASTEMPSNRTIVTAPSSTWIPRRYHPGSRGVSSSCGSRPDTEPAPAAPIPLASLNIYRVTPAGSPSAGLVTDGAAGNRLPGATDSGVERSVRHRPTSSASAHPPVQLAALPAGSTPWSSATTTTTILDIDTVVALVGMQRNPVPSRSGSAPTFGRGCSAGSHC